MMLKHHRLFLFNRSAELKELNRQDQLKLIPC